MSTDETVAFPIEDRTWQLDSIFEGGTDSDAFESFMESLGARLEQFEERIETIEPLEEADARDGAVLDAWVDLLVDMQEIEDRIREAASYARTLSAVDAESPEAMALLSRVSELASQWDRREVELVGRVKGAPERAFDWLAGRSELEGLELSVRELQRDAERAMPVAREQLASDLQRDGLHAWGDVYKLASGGLEVEIFEPESDERETLSVGQAKNRLSDPDRGLRREIHGSLQETWEERAPFFASVLNSIVGSRQTVCDHRGTDPLTEPLDNNRIRRETLDAMFDAAEEFRPDLQRYLASKADALGVDRLEWFDRMAPPADEAADDISYEEAQTFIVEHVSSFSERIATFYRRAFQNHWVESENRGGKAQGAFCTTFPVSGEVRVFTTYSGTMQGVTTLAHELGHAYHGWMMREMPAAARRVPMTLAESASTLSEKIVEEAALERVGEDRMFNLLDQRLQRAATFLLDIPARFDLEVEMFRARRKGRLEPEGLIAMTREAFGRHFGDGVGSYDDYFWASKLHYYLTRAPFYNFPYTFGYLFSKAIYGRLREAGTEAGEMVDDLLRDSGRMRAEELAERYLGADLTEPEFWVGAAGTVREDVAQYETLVRGG